MRSNDPAVESVPCGRWLLHDDPLWPAVLARLSHDIYHEPAYLQAEARWIGGRPEAFLHVEGDALWFAPYIARRDRLPGLRAAGRILDVVSPYGFPGPIGSPEHAAPGFCERAFAAFLAGLRERGAVSAFLRSHPSFDALPPVDRWPGVTEHDWKTVLIELDGDLEAIWSRVSRRRRQQINKCRRVGMQVRRVALRDGLPVLMGIYDETMDRVGANADARFDAAYFHRLAPLAGHLEVWLVERRGTPIAATLVSRRCDIIQTPVGGTCEAALADSPDSLLCWELITWGHATGAGAVHLGGGVGGRDDGVLRFKASFGPGRARFRTLRAVLDPARYADLTAARAVALGVGVRALDETGFFPAYRSRPTVEVRPDQVRPIGQ